MESLELEGMESLELDGIDRVGPEGIDGDGPDGIDGPGPEAKFGELGALYKNKIELRQKNAFWLYNIYLRCRTSRWTTH